MNTQGLSLFGLDNKKTAQVILYGLGGAHLGRSAPVGGGARRSVRRDGGAATPGPR